MRARGWAVACLCLTLPSLSQGQPANPAIAAWRSLAKADLDAAHRLILDNHPAASAELQDHAFQDRLRAAYAEGTRRAAAIDGYPGYVALLSSFATSLEDEHLYVRPLYADRALDWAGLIVSKQGSSWVVVDQREGSPGGALTGWRLADCDGRPADKFAEEILRSRAVWKVEAQQAKAAPWLFVDERNPFVKRAESCVFEKDGQTQSVRLAWTSTARADLVARMNRHLSYGAAGFGVRRVGDGYWIAIQSLDGRAAAVADQVRQQAEALRKAPFIVLDLRGDGGGNSVYGLQIANAIFGGGFVASTLSADPGAGCSSVWRASPGNIRQLEAYIQKFGAISGPYFQRLANQARQAQKDGKDFGGPVTCPQSKPPAQPATAVKPEFSGRMVLLTDGACFSSCLLVTKLFREFGALHVGQSTDAGTRYMEVREEPLPSGLAMSSTLQAVSPSDPPQMGPFRPAKVYEGDIADTPAVERWIGALMATTTRE